MAVWEECRSKSVVRTATTLMALTVAVATAVPASASTDTDGGPPLAVGRATVVHALHCTGDLRTSRRRPVLLLHGTTGTAHSEWSWNWDRSLDARHWAHCDLDLPDSANGDVQTSAEYVTRAIRIMYRRAGRPISIVGHSQGGMIARWSLKYWPDTRRMVTDYVGLASSNHGTRVFDLQCATIGGCAAANWQQRTNSTFLRALNAGPEVWPGISYTEVSTRYDEIVIPSTSPYLTPGPLVSNVAVQDLCPGEVVDHLGMSYDNAAWLIGLDALTHPGPARLPRISRATCGRPFMPGVNPLTLAVDVAAAAAQSAISLVTAPQLAAEPPLRCYVLPRCSTA